MDIHTLQDFLTLTKGQEYLIAIGAMIIFAAFWLYLDSSPRNKKPDRRKTNDQPANMETDNYRSKA